MRALFVGCLLLLASACGPALPPLEVPEGCQPLLAGADCLLPYPSDFFRVADGALPSGFRISATGAASLRSEQGKPADVTQVLPIDGYSTASTVVAVLGAPVSPTGFVALEQGGAPTLDVATTNTVLVEADTGALVGHFVDLDPRALSPARQAIVLHPHQGLKAGTRYVVGLKGVTGPDGAAVPAPEGFARLRDNRAGGDPKLEPLAKRYDADVFGVLEKAGVPRASLQLAWDFTTGTHRWATRDLLRVRELTQAWLGGNTPTVSVTQVQDEATGTYRVVRGTVTGPRFVTTALAGAKLVRGADGQVAQDGTVDFPFLAIIPRSVLEATAPSKTFLYGHGFFGNLDELTGGSAVGIAQHAQRTMLGTEWWGMSTSDLGKIIDALNLTPARATEFMERVHQGMANWLVLAAAVEGLQGAPAFQKAGGGSVIASGPDSYLGISQGHILGGTMAALSPRLKHVALQVGGAGLTGVMMRARPFQQFLDFLGTSVPEPLEQQKFLALIQRHFDRIEPATWAQHLRREPLPGDAPKRLLLQAGLGDLQVPNLGTYFHARTAGVPLLTPSPVTPWGLATTAAPAEAALVLFDFNKGDLDALYRTADFAGMDNGVHDGVRRTTAAKEQLKQFFDTGVIQQTCQGPCDPE